MNVKRVLAGTMSLAMIGSLLTPAAAAKAEEPSTQGTNNYIVVVRDDVPPAAQYSMAEGAEVVEAAGSRNYMVLSMTEAEAAELAQDERVLSVEEDIIVTAMSETGEDAEKEEDGDLDVIVRLEDLVKPQEYEWNLTAVHATPDELAAYATDESIVRVAVLDSGMSVCEDLDVAEYVNLVSTEQEITTYDEDATGHGTAVAGLLAGNIDDEGIIGIAPDVTMYSVRVFDQTNEAPISRIIEGIYWAIDHDIHIINMSFGTHVNSYALHQAIQAAAQADILMVAAAGNGAIVEYPAAYPEVMAVGATDYQGVRASFSAMGDALELVAPGECVLTDSFYGGVMALDGTSLAAPQVAGAAAVLWAKDMSKSSDFIRQLLNASANGSLGGTIEYGNGLLNVRRAFEIYDAFEESYVPGVFEYAGIAENLEPYVAGDEPGYVTGSWAGTQHAATINQGKGNYSTENLSYMKKVSSFLDTRDSGFSSSWSTSNFHGGRNYGSSARRETTNYVGDVILLYKLAVALKDMKGQDLDKQRKKVDEIVKELEDCTTVKVYPNFPTKIKELLGTSIESASGVENQISAEVNTYKILGAALHLAGDIYAHRSMLPMNSVNTTTSDPVDNDITGNYFNLNHFTRGTACAYDKIEEKAYNAIVIPEKDTNRNTASLCDPSHWECFEIGVKKGIMEFKDIYRFAKSRAYSAKYEDGVNFYKSRYSVGAVYTTKCILDSFLNNTELNGELFLPGVYSGKSYAIRLNALKILYQQLDFEWDESNWASYTTKEVR